jgi:HK97 family phage portal protein
MGLFRSIERRASAFEYDGVGAFTRVSSTVAGRKVSQDSARCMTAVLACQGLIADGISALPVDFLRKGKGDASEALPDAQRPKWAKTPNPYQTPINFWHRVVTSLLSDGNAFILTLRDDRGFVTALYAIHPEAVSIEQAKVTDEPKYRVDGALLDRSQMLHIAGFTVGSDPRGLSPIDMAREAIGMGLTIEEYGARFFSQGTTLSGIIEHPGKPEKGEAKILREMFRKSHAGTNNSHAVGILTGGAQFRPISIEPDKAQFLESRRFQNSQIALLCRVPAYIVDASVTSTWGSGIQEQNTFLVQHTFLPWAVRIEQAVSLFLLPGGQFMKFNFDAMLRPKTTERFAAYETALNNGWMNADEIRALEDLPPLPKGFGQKWYRPTNNSSEIGAKPEPSKAVAPAPIPDPAPTDPAATDPADAGQSKDTTT